MSTKPEPTYLVAVSGRLHKTEPTALAFDLPDGTHDLYTAAQLNAAVAAERERCARLCKAAWHIDGQLTADEFAWLIRTEWADDDEAPAAIRQEPAR